MIHRSSGRFSVFVVALVSPCAVAVLVLPVAARTATHARAARLLDSTKLAGAPLGADARTIVYESRDLKDDAIRVSGLVIIPRGDNGTRAQSRNIVAWAHPTVGVASKCAPSAQGMKVFATIPGLEALLQRGYVVVSTDYPGLGSPGAHPYLVGLSEGRAIIDAVRATRDMSDANVGDRFAVWGHSQGAHAALFARTTTAHYAPELTLVGAATAAPPTDLKKNLSGDDEHAAIRGALMAFTVWSWSRVYDAPVRALTFRTGERVVDRFAQTCTDPADVSLRTKVEILRLRRQLGHVDPSNIEPWASLLDKNSPDIGPRSIPLFIAQGTADQVVAPAVTTSFARRACSAGVPVRFQRLEGIDHRTSATQAADAAVAWIADRFAGSTPPSDCDALARDSTGLP